MIFVSVTPIETRTSEKTKVGTGSFLRYEWEGGTKKTDFLVTNRHVIRDGLTSRFRLKRLENGHPSPNQIDTYEVNGGERDWFCHPDKDVDVAILYMGRYFSETRKQGFEPYYAAIDKSIIPPTEVVEELQSVEEVTFVGFPTGLYDKTNFIPIVRKGVTASPAAVDYDGKSVFLIDASIFPGSSGSPVFIMNAGAYLTRKGINVGTRTLFLGIVSQSWVWKPGFQPEPADAPSVADKQDQNKDYIDLGTVVKTRAILETVQAFLRGNGEKV